MKTERVVTDEELRMIDGIRQGLYHRVPDGVTHDMDVSLFGEDSAKANPTVPEIAESLDNLCTRAGMPLRHLVEQHENRIKRGRARHNEQRKLEAMMKCSPITRGDVENMTGMTGSMLVDEEKYDLFMRAWAGLNRRWALAQIAAAEAE